MRIAMVASEANPLAKSGGLADVIFALSKALKAKGDDVCVVMPLYQSVRRKYGDKIKALGTFKVYMSWRQQEAEVARLNIEGIPYYLIGNSYYFDRNNLYGYGDDGERFAFFTLAARNLLPFVKFQPDIIHIHDWQPGLLPTLIKTQNREDPFYKGTRFVLTIHNPEFKGYLDRQALDDLYGLPFYLFDSGDVRFDGMVSTLKAAIVHADKITTVSPSHRCELLTPEGSRGLDGVLRLREFDFVGIVNGIDEQEWDPGKDPLLAAHFDAKKLSGKEECRKALLKYAGFADDGAPIFGLVSRLTNQKGIDILLPNLRWMLERGSKMFLLGSGEPGIEYQIEQLRAEFPDRFSIYIGMNFELAHSIYAGSDFFLMPSLFEPCGIGQMIAERYGSLPIARATGGLIDTIESYDGSNENEATGFLFREFSPFALGSSILAALELYGDKEKLAKVKTNAMTVDHSWDASSEKYRSLYRAITR